MAPGGADSAGAAQGGAPGQDRLWYHCLAGVAAAVVLAEDHLAVHLGGRGSGDLPQNMPRPGPQHPLAVPAPSSLPLLLPQCLGVQPLRTPFTCPSDV